MSPFSEFNDSITGLEFDVPSPIERKEHDDSRKDEIARGYVDLYIELLQSFKYPVLSVQADTKVEIFF